MSGVLLKANFIEIPKLKAKTYTKRKNMYKSFLMGIKVKLFHNKICVQKLRQCLSKSFKQSFSVQAFYIAWQVA